MFLLREILKKKHLYAFTPGFLVRLEYTAEVYSNIVEVERYPEPREVEGFRGMVYGVARVKQPKETDE